MRLPGRLPVASSFTEMAFPKLDFSGLSIAGSMFAKVNLPDSSFYGYELADTEFFQCNPRKPDFRQASG